MLRTFPNDPRTLHNKLRLFFINNYRGEVFFVAVINIFNRMQYDPLGQITSTGGLYQYF